jgi:hypothetical protein
MALNLIFSAGGAAPSEPATIRITPTAGSPIDLALSTKVSEGTFSMPAPFNISQLFYDVPATAALQTAMPGMFVKWRPDTNGLRHEVILEHCLAIGPNRADLTSYTVAVLDGTGATVMSGSSPVHFFYARWSLRSAARPIVRTAAELKDEGKTFYYNTSSADPTPTYVAYAPMGKASVYFPMGDTGGRSDIGVLPGWTAQYLASGNTTARDIMMANAFVSSSIVWNYRDSNGQIFNIDNFPGYGISHGTTFAAPTSFRDGDFPNPAINHPPSLCYVPFLLTGDSFFLEQLQFQAGMGLYSWDANNGSGMLISQVWEQRTVAWTLRELAFAAIATPSSGLPSTMLSRDYFLRKLANTRQALSDSTVNSIDPAKTIYHFPHYYNLVTRRFAGYQMSYMTSVINAIVHAGVPGWQPILDWVGSGQANVAGGIGGTSGWDYPYWYWANITDNTGDIPADFATAFTLNNVTTPLAWWTDWAGFQVDAGIQVGYLDLWYASMQGTVAHGHSEYAALLAAHPRTATPSWMTSYTVPAVTPPTIPDVATDAYYVSPQVAIAPSGTLGIGDWYSSVRTWEVNGGAGSTLTLPGAFGYFAVPYTSDTVLISGTTQFVVKGVATIIIGDGTAPDGGTWDMATMTWTS